MYFLNLQSGIQIVEVETAPAFDHGVPTVAVAYSGLAETLAAGLTYDLAPDGERFLVRVPAARSSDSFTGMIIVQHWFEELKERVPVP